MVMLPIPCANRSPVMFDGATEVDIDRRPNRHIGFGSGPHRCLGIHLARSVTDTIEYAREDGENCLRLTKRAPAPPVPGSA